MVLIVQTGDPVLRQMAQKVPIADITTQSIKSVIKNMQQALSEQEDGVAIAAPQIGESLRIFVVSGKVLSKNYPDLVADEIISDDLICINPELSKLSKDKKKMPEG
nr:peptide deformylase [Patescibacteria group bacterium]